MLNPAASSITRKSSPQVSESINVVCAADDAYAMPLAVTLKSACQNLRSGTGIQLYLLDGGISEENWAGLKETLANEPIEIQVITPNSADLSDLVISHHISHTAYFRLLAAELLPDEIDKAIYLDSDLLVKEDISHLWNQPLDGQYCLATVDIACPYIDARTGCSNFRLANPYMASFRPVRNYQELGLDGRGEYFNSGVMVLNLDLWRRENVADRLLRTLRDNRKFVWCWDQYALNVAFHDNWGKFSPRWNQGAHVFEYPTANHSPIDADDWTQMKESPAIVHFTTEFKPWQFQSDHPRSELFYEGLADTAWHSWSPDRPEFSFRDWLNHRMLKLYKRGTISTRKAMSFWM